MHEIIRTAQESRRIGVVGDIYSFLVTGEETGGAACVFEGIVPPGGGPPPHMHTREDEIFHVLEGELSFEIDGKFTVGRAGTSVFAPRGQRHRFFNASSAPARMIVTMIPAGLEKMFFEVAVPVAPGATEAPAPTPEHIGAVIAACPRYGITFFPPGC